MNVGFRITAVNQADRSFTVEFFTDEVSSPTNITMYRDPMPTGQALIDFIWGFAPLDWLKVATLSRKNPPDMQELEAMIGKTVTKPVAELERFFGRVPVSEAL